MTIYPLSLLLLFLLTWPLYHQVNTFPVNYVYFNALAGGNKKAWGNYEYDYYFHGLKEPAEYLIGIVGDRNVTVAMNCSLSNYFEGHNNITFKYTRYMERSSADWDYGLFGVNYIHPYLLKNDLWQPAGALRTFYHRGNPVAILVRRQDKSDYIGISELNKLNLGSATVLLEQVMKNDPNNVWLHATNEKCCQWLKTLCVDIKERTTGSQGNRDATRFFREQLEALVWET